MAEDFHSALDCVLRAWPLVLGLKSGLAMSRGFSSKLVVALGLMVAGCSSLPSTGPTSTEVVEQANSGSEIRYILQDIDDNIVSILAKTRPSTFQTSFGDHRPPPSQRIGIGDTISVTIWEAAAGGLFSSPAIDRNSTGARSAVIPSQIVARDGSITVPYAGRIRVAGLTTPEVEQRIVSGLTGKAVEPQVLVTVPLGLSNSVTVLGEVTNGARVPLSVRGERILDVIASAGGIRAPTHETFVNLQRGGRSIAVPMQRLIKTPSENIYAHPSDVITVVRDPQTYSVFGAASRNAVVPFEAAGITLEQAVAKAGGLLDYRSDPYGVFLLRYETAQFARMLDPSFDVTSAKSMVPVVYRLNLRDPKSYFLAQQVHIRNRDVLYVANAPVNELQKILQLFTTAAQPIATGAAVAASF